MKYFFNKSLYHKLHYHFMNSFRKKIIYGKIKNVTSSDFKIDSWIQECEKENEFSLCQAGIFVHSSLKGIETEINSSIKLFFNSKNQAYSTIIGHTQRSYWILHSIIKKYYRNKEEKTTSGQAILGPAIKSLEGGTVFWETALLAQIRASMFSFRRISKWKDFSSNILCASIPHKYIEAFQLFSQLEDSIRLIWEDVLYGYKKLTYNREDGIWQFEPLNDDICISHEAAIARRMYNSLQQLNNFRYFVFLNTGFSKKIIHYSKQGENLYTTVIDEIEIKNNYVTFYSSLENCIYFLYEKLENIGDITIMDIWNIFYVAGNSTT